MEILTTPVPGLVLIKPLVFTDQRGYFFESYHAERYAGTALPELRHEAQQSLQYG